MIRSVEYDQSVILNDILRLNDIDCFEIDLSYGKGQFYKKVPEPVLKIDIDPQNPSVSKGCSTSTGLPEGAFGALVFDPPFLTYIKEARQHGSIMAKRFGGYWAYSELEAHYKGTLKEAYRLLRKKGILVFKCQDIIHNHKMHATHINVVNWAENLFRLKDLFILPAKHRMPMPQGDTAKRVQKHARVYHSYFLVLEKL